jgi:hypothetical protein
MAEDRPQKQTVRSLWLDAVTQFAEAFPDDPHPLYVTLSGAEGRDIALLIEAGLIQTTETGAISTVHRHRVVAVERNTVAVIALQKKYPGLKILEHPFQNLVRGDSPLRWPDGDDVRHCRARVVNLDLDETLSARKDAGEIRFPVLSWISKLAQIHAVDRLDWSLCFTLHGEIEWDSQTSVAVCDFLVENFRCEEAFATASQSFLGSVVFSRILDERPIDLSAVDVGDQQRILMVFVPKKIASLVCQQGWKVSTGRNLRYGGTGGHAPMVTWIVNFSWHAQASSNPDPVYRACLREILNGVGAIEEDGRISEPR